MTATSPRSGPPGADCDHMSSRPSSSSFWERRWHWDGAWWWNGARHGGGFGRAGVWRLSVVLILFSFLCLSLTADGQILDEYAQNRTALNRRIHYEVFRFLNSTKIITGDIQNLTVPTDINDESVELEAIRAVRLRSGSLKRYGVNFGDIHLQPGVLVVDAPVHVVLVYRRFKEYGFYDSINGTVFVAPVVGILAYNYNDVKNYTNYGKELTVVATQSPIQVRLQADRDIAEDRQACILYDNTVNGTATGVYKNVTTSVLCEWNVLGDYALLGPPKKSSDSTWKIVLGSVLGGIVALILLVLLVFLFIWYRQRARFADMEHKSDQGESLHHTWFGTSRAPSAAGTRTKPILENENV